MMTIEFVNRGFNWCDFCQTEHSSSSCDHPGRTKYDVLLALARRLRKSLTDEIACGGGTIYFAETHGAIFDSVWLEE